jgi:sugar/nucleoside kinase (ribokinase family)
MNKFRYGNEVTVTREGFEFYERHAGAQDGGTAGVVLSEQIGKSYLVGRVPNDHVRVLFCEDELRAKK